MPTLGPSRKNFLKLRPYARIIDIKMILPDDSEDKTDFDDETDRLPIIQPQIPCPLSFSDCSPDIWTIKEARQGVVSSEDWAGKREISLVV